MGHKEEEGFERISSFLLSLEFWVAWRGGSGIMYCSRDGTDGHRTQFPFSVLRGVLFIRESHASDPDSRR